MKKKTSRKRAGSKAHKAANTQQLPLFKPRRPLADSEPEGLMESDRDFVLNNLELAVALLESHSKTTPALSPKGWVAILGELKSLRQHLEVIEWGAPENPPALFGYAVDEARKTVDVLTHAVEQFRAMDEALDAAKAAAKGGGSSGNGA